MLHEDVTRAIINAFYKVYNDLGYGFLEKIYENLLILELSKTSYQVEQQFPVKVIYQNVVVGDYFADLLVGNKVIVEIKAVEKLASQHEAQLINYLKATDFEVGLLLNSGPKAQFKRKLFTNDQKIRS